ncbi:MULTISPECIES: tetratricopeptide repeat protein [Bacteroidales]|uniref:tetratricopeptide repeat protein n=1 Tax=Bacteroidales TaxID=171549 RepID=UPI0012B90750|nr:MULTISPECIES: tetratricopeptide repeat protein [Bacteroidales]
MMKKAIFLLALVEVLSACKKSDNTYQTQYEKDGCEYDYYIGDVDGLDYATIERYVAFDIADDYRSIVALMDSLIDAGTPLNSWSSVYANAMNEAFPLDSILPRLLKLHKCEPSNMPVYWAIGYTYNNLGDAQKAIEWFHKGLNKAPDSSNAWYGLGIVTLQQGDTVSAVNNFRKAHELAQEHNLESWAIRIQMTLDSIESKDQLRVTEPISETANTTWRRRWKRFFSGLRT